MEGMFSSCKSLKSLYLKKFNTAKVFEMSYMFNNCVNLKTLDLSSFKTKKVGQMNQMFENCKSLKILDIRNFDLTGQFGSGSAMFYKFSKTATVIATQKTKDILIGYSCGTEYVKHWKIIDVQE